MLGILFIVSALVGVILWYLYDRYNPTFDIIKDEITQHKMLVMWYNDYSKNRCYRTFYVITEL
jgi:ATP/ADP translocase